MIVTVKRFKEIVANCPEGWTVVFRKWEHMDGTPWFNGYKGWPNVVDLRIIDSAKRINDIDGKTIFIFTFEENDDDRTEMKSEEVFKMFCEGKNDDDMIDCRLEIEEIPGHFVQIPMKPSAGDKGWSDKQVLIDFDEE